MHRSLSFEFSKSALNLDDTSVVGFDEIFVVDIFKLRDLLS